MRPLTPRQRQVIEAASRGLTARQIAAELGMSYMTLRTHRQDILRRLKSHSMVEAAVKYERERCAEEFANRKVVTA